MPSALAASGTEVGSFLPGAQNGIVRNEGYHFEDMASKAVMLKEIRRWRHQMAGV